MPAPKPPANSVMGKLLAAARLDPVKRVISLNDGNTIELWFKPLTAAERRAARLKVGSDDNLELAKQLLCDKAMDARGQKIFTMPMILELERESREVDFMKVLMAPFDESEVEELPDMKRAEEAVQAAS